MQWKMFHGQLDFASSPRQRGGSNTKPGDHATSNRTTHDIVWKGPHD
jgi:hypothetical protein